MRDYLIMDKGYLPSHAGLRGIISIVVLYCHFYVFFVKNPQPPYSLPTPDLFFILSGFIMTRQYRAAMGSGLITIQDFLIRRIFRLWPMYMLSVTLFVIVFYMSVQPYYLAHGYATKVLDPGTGPQLGINILSQVTMLSSLGFLPMPWNGPAWSVSAEWIVNLFFVLVLIRIQRLYRPMLAVIAFVCFYYLVSISPLSMNLDAADSWFFNPPIARALLGFCIGSLICGALKTLPYIRKKLLNSIEALLIINFILLFYYAYNDFQIGTDYIILFTVGIPLVVITLYRHSFIGKVASYRPFPYLGKISYSIYLLQMPIGYFYMFDPWIKTLNLHKPWFGIVYLFIVIAAASLTHYGVERPLHKLGQKLTGGRLNARPQKTL